MFGGWRSRFDVGVVSLGLLAATPLIARTATATTGSGSGVVGDRVWLDSNRDGRQQPSESGVAGVRVELWTVPEGRLLTSTATNGRGAYWFAGLATERCYRVRVVIPAGLAATRRDVGSDWSDSDISSLGVMPRWVCPGWGHNARLNMDAGLISGGSSPPPSTTTTTPLAGTTTTNPPATTTRPTTTTNSTSTTSPGAGTAVIEGHGFQDLNGNRLLDPGEPPIAGLRVDLIWGQCVDTRGCPPATTQSHTPTSARRMARMVST